MSTETVDNDVATIAAQTRHCQKCGASIEPFDKFCHGCGDPQAGAEPITAELATEHKYLRCENCGAEITIDPALRSYVCPFCDSTYVVEFSPAESGRQAPEFIIGFAITPDDALARFRKWLAEGGIWRPSDLRMAEVEDKLKGVYLPFWSFSMRAHSRWSASIGEHWYRTETYTETDAKGNTVTKTRQVQETEWYPLAGKHHRYYSGYLVSGSKGLPQDQALRVQPVRVHRVRGGEHVGDGALLDLERQLVRSREAVDGVRVHRGEHLRQRRGGEDRRSGSSPGRGAGVAAASGGGEHGDGPDDGGGDGCGRSGAHEASSPVVGYRASICDA